MLVQYMLWPCVCEFVCVAVTSHKSFIKMAKHVIMQTMLYDSTVPRFLTSKINWVTKYM